MVINKSVIEHDFRDSGESFTGCLDDAAATLRNTVVSNKHLNTTDFSSSTLPFSHVPLRPIALVAML
jgi:hypothetical protein